MLGTGYTMVVRLLKNIYMKLHMYVCMYVCTSFMYVPCTHSCTLVHILQQTYYYTTTTLKEGTTNTPLPAQTDVIRRWARYFFAAVHFPIQITFRICLTYFGGPQDARQHLWVITAGSRHFLAPKYRPIDITFRVSGRKTSTSRFDVPSCWFGSIVPQCVSVVPGLFWN